MRLGFRFPRPGLRVSTLGAALLLAGVLAAAVHVLRARLRDETHRSLVERAASVLEPLANRQVALAAADAPGETGALLLPVLHSARFEGMAAVAVYDANGNLVRAFPETFAFAELATRDYLALLVGPPQSRFHEAFPMERYFSVAPVGQGRPPMLEVAVALRRRDDITPVGFAQYYLDGRGLAAELAVVDARIDRLTWTVLGFGWASIAAVLGGAYAALQRARRTVEERSARLAQANLELALAAKSSALGQITSHLIHGLQGPVAELRTMTAEKRGGDDWRLAADCAEKMQRLIADAVGLLGEAHASVHYEVTGDELLAAINQRVGEEVRSRGVVWSARGGGGWTVDNRCAGIVGLIAANLVQNAARATPAGRTVAAELTQADGTLVLRVEDEGGGIPEAVRARLFTPGASGRAEGTGLGLAISRLLARQLGGELTLEHTGESGTSFRLAVPVRRAE